MTTAEEALSPELFRAAIERQATAVAILRSCDDERDLRYVYVNPAFQALKPRLPMLGRKYTEVWPEAAPHLLPAMQRVLKTGEPWTGRDARAQVERQPGLLTEEYVTFDDARLQVDGGPYLLSELRITTPDVEARRRAERDLEATRLLLQTSQALTETMDLQRVLRRLTEMLLALTPHTRSFVFLWDSERRILTQAASAGREAFKPGRTFTYDALSTVTQRVVETHRTAVVDFDALPESERGAALAAQRSHVLLDVPVVWRDRLVGLLGVDDPGERREFTAREIDLVEGIAASSAVAIENARLFEQQAASLRALAEKDRAIRQAYSDVIDAVTGGRLIILGGDELEHALIPTLGPEHPIKEPEDLGKARVHLREVLDEVPDADNLILAFSEAVTNILKHAGGGSYRVGLSDGRLQIVVTDHGPGIDFRDLPKATLVPGFSTQQTLGMGFTIMMELTDRLLLSTSGAGTTLVLEKDVIPSENAAKAAAALERGA